MSRQFRASECEEPSLLWAQVWVQQWKQIWEMLSFKNSSIVHLPAVIICQNMCLCRIEQKIYRLIWRQNNLNFWPKRDCLSVLFSSSLCNLALRDALTWRTNCIFQRMVSKWHFVEALFPSRHVSVLVYFSSLRWIIKF